VGHRARLVTEAVGNVLCPAGDRKIWRVAGNIMNTESRTGGKGCSSGLEDERRANKPHRKQFVTKQSVEPRNWADSYACLKYWNTDMRFGMWYIRSRYRTGSLRTVSRALRKCKLDLVGEEEVRWKKGALNGQKFIHGYS
jgi:hypothetical protein